MAVSWTTLTNAKVAAGAAITTALMTALRDNPEGIAQRASGAPKIFGVPYDFQEFTASGTWTKPSIAEAGDRVVIQVVGGGGAGGRDSTAADATGGSGAGGIVYVVEDIDDLDASVTVTVGAGAAGRSSNGDGGNGGDSRFQDTAHDIIATGGDGGPDNGGAPNPVGVVTVNGASFVAEADGSSNGTTDATSGGVGSDSSAGSFNAGSSIYGGGGGGAGGGGGNNTLGGPSLYGGGGGAVGAGGFYPGGAGGGSSTTSGDGADGVVRVWCIKEE